MEQLEHWKEKCRRLEAENAQLRQECLRSRRQELLEHLLRGEFNFGAEIAADLRDVGVFLTKDSFLELYVNVLSLPPAPGGTAQASTEFREKYEEGIGRLVRQFYPEYYAASLRVGTGVAAILQTDQFPKPPELSMQLPKGNFIDSLNRRALQLADTLCERDGLEAFVAISRPHAGIEEIPDAHQEILEIDNYRTVMELDVPLLCYHDFELAEGDSASQLRLEQKYLSCVELGEYEQARQILKTMMDQEFRQTIPSLFSLRYRLSAKLGLLLITLDKFQTQEQPAIFDEVLGLQKALTQDDLTVERLQEKIDLIFDHIAAFLNQQHTPKWLAPLLQYVEEHYTCSELNVASICDVFGLSPSYLTREVKRCTGNALLDLLQKKRLDQAIELIGGGTGMARAAVLSGFGDTRSMRRAFQKYIHTTPQQYLENRPIQSDSSSTVEAEKK